MPHIVRMGRKNDESKECSTETATSSYFFIHEIELYYSGGGYSSGSDDKDYDNMRGFDPASEDDMEDNGMTRYMENNDEEGWD